MFRTFEFRSRSWMQFAAPVLEAAFLLTLAGFLCAFGSIANEQPVQLAAAALSILSVSYDMHYGTTHGVVPPITRQGLHRGQHLWALAVTVLFFLWAFCDHT
jgi:hypothetical protein